jgi:hypothetical protein
MRRGRRITPLAKGAAGIKRKSPGRSKRWEKIGGEMAETIMDEYAQLIAVRNNELQLHWTRFNIALVVNAGVLAAAVAGGTGPIVAGLPRWAMPGFGFGLAVVWLLMAAASGYWIYAWERHLRTFETGKDLYGLFTKANTVSGPYLIDQGPGIVGMGMPVLFMLVWGWMLVTE